MRDAGAPGTRAEAISAENALLCSNVEGLFVREKKASGTKSDFGGSRRIQKRSPGVEGDPVGPDWQAHIGPRTRRVGRAGTRVPNTLVHLAAPACPPCTAASRTKWPAWRAQGQRAGLV